LARKKKKEKKGLFNKFLVRIAAAAICAGCVLLIYTIENDRAEKEHDIAATEGKIEALEIQNADLQRILDSDDISDYIERVAVEERGYAYPDERRFYDTSRD